MFIFSASIKRNDDEKAIIISVLEQIEKSWREDWYWKAGCYNRLFAKEFAGFFKEKCGVSIGKYIRQRKLSRSATLLKLTSQSVTDIAFRMGFDSVQSYSREFKKHLASIPITIARLISGISETYGLPTGLTVMSIISSKFVSLRQKKFSDFKRLIRSQQMTFLKSVAYKMENHSWDAQNVGRKCVLSLVF